jgi:hypothetical protein
VYQHHNQKSNASRVLTHCPRIIPCSSWPSDGSEKDLTDTLPKGTNMRPAQKDRVGHQFGWTHVANDVMACLKHDNEGYQVNSWMLVILYSPLTKFYASVAFWLLEVADEVDVVLVQLSTKSAPSEM